MSFTAPGIDTRKSDFIVDFYKTSDRNEKGGDEYIAFLTPEVDFVMGLKALKGHDAVKQLRSGMWNGVNSRHHVPRQAFSLDDKASEIMLHGTVTYGLEKGDTVDVEWAAKMVFAQDSDELKLSSYQVWLDSTPLKEAMAKQSSS